MQAKLSKIVFTYLDQNQVELSNAAVRADKCDTSSLRLGKSEQLKFLAATGYSSLDEAAADAVIVKSMKRGMLLKCGVLLYYFNQYGVSYCLVPGPCEKGALSVVWGPSLPFELKDRLLRPLGVKRQYCDKRKEYIYDYSDCPENLAFSDVSEEYA